MEKELVLLGRRIAKLRNKRHLTQEALAEMVERSPNHISKLEIATTNPSFELLVKIAKALNVEMYELFRFEETICEKDIKIKLQNLINSSQKENIELLYKIYCALED